MEDVKDTEQPAAVVTMMHHRHKWIHIRDITIIRRKSRSIQFSAKGEYRCDCGATKRGSPVGGL